MKITLIKKLAPIAAPASALLLLAACGQGDTAGDADAGVEEVAAPQTAENVEWLPDAIVLPQEHVLLNDAKLGVRTNLLQVTVEEDPSAQFPVWKSALEEAGYTVTENENNGGLRFSGNGVESGQITVPALEDAEGFMIQIDITRDA